MKLTAASIAPHRLRNQLLVGAPGPARAADEVVRWLGAVQSQDYGAAKWALAQRSATRASGDLDQLFNEGRILRTHVLRPTWHFVAPDDARWLLALTGPRVIAGSATYYRNLELDEKIFPRSNAALAKALHGGVQLTRVELAKVLARAGVVVSGIRLAFVLMRAELDSVIISGPLRGKQFTYALFDDRVPPSAPLPREAALAEIARRYFTSHGPALPSDFAWWAGLTITDAKIGIEGARAQLGSEILDGKTYWFAASSAPTPKRRATVHLLPNYDEYLVAYQDRSAFIGPARTAFQALANVVLVDGAIAGGWRRTVGKKRVDVTTDLHAPLAPTARAALEISATEYGRFLGVPCRISDR